MIFRPELAKKILAGRKTMTRRPVQGPCRYREGKSYAVQPGRGKGSVGRITVIMVRQEPVGGITLPDARREGFRTRQEFIDYWTMLYGSFDATQPVWVIGFSLGDYEDKLRLLRARPGHEGDKDGDYVSNPAQALAGTAEEVSEGYLGLFSATAEEKHRFIRVEQKSAQRAVISSLRLAGASNRELRAAHSSTGQKLPVVYDRVNAA